MSNRESAKRLREENTSSRVDGCDTQEGIEELKEQVSGLQEKVAEISAVCESLIENVGSLEEENLELRRAMEAQGSSLTS